MYKDYLFCFDVDGTLRDTTTHEVSSSTLEALHKLTEQGYKIVISSGRGVDSLESTGIMDQANWSAYICNNGQIILDKDKHVLYKKTMDPDAVRKVLEIADRLGYAVTCKAHPRFITKEPDENVLRAQAFFGNKIPGVGEYHGQEVDAMNVFGDIGYDYHDFMGIKGITVLPGESSYSDFVIEGVSKASAISFLQDYFKTPKSVSFGDSLNDVDMFKHCDINIAMGQGNDYLKSLASYVTTDTNNNGIYNACKHYKFI